MIVDDEATWREIRRYLAESDSRAADDAERMMVTMHLRKCERARDRLGGLDAHIAATVAPADDVADVA